MRKKGILCLLLAVALMIGTAAAERTAREIEAILKQACYINPDGGTMVHSVPDCPSVHPKYIPLTKVEYTEEIRAGYSFCPICCLDEHYGETDTAASPAGGVADYAYVILEYRAAIHDPHYDSDFRDTFFSYEWRDYVDDPRSEPAYALIGIENREVLLIGDRKDPAGMIRRMYRQEDGEIRCVAESGPDEAWYLLSDGTAVRKEALTGQESFLSVQWTRFWESRKAIVAAEDTGGVTSRNGLGKDSYTLGKEQTGLVIVVDEVTDGWAWFRYNATRKGYKAAGWGYVPDSGLLYPENTEPSETAVLARNGKTSGNIMINVRFRPTTKARKILELPVGTEVDVYGSENGWTEIEWNRWHGYVKDEFVQ